jgi:hypothetical protein
VTLFFWSFCEIIVVGLWGRDEDLVRLNLIDASILLWRNMHQLLHKSRALESKLESQSEIKASLLILSRFQLGNSGNAFAKFWTSELISEQNVQPLQISALGVYVMTIGNLISCLCCEEFMRQQIEQEKMDKTIGFMLLNLLRMSSNKSKIGFKTWLSCWSVLL